MNKKILGIVVVILVVGAVVAGIAAANKNKKVSSNNNSNQAVANSNIASRDVKSTENADITIYYGQGCPHCKKVEENIIAKNLDQKIAISMKEVWYDKNNANEMNEKADICKISKDELGVPLLYDAKTQKCFTGDADVNKHLEEQAANAGTDANSNSGSTNTNSSNANTNS